MPSPVAEYLLRLDRHLWGLPARRRDEILGDVRQHLEDALEEDPQANCRNLAWLQTAHGSPEELGRDFRHAHWKDNLLNLGDFAVLPGAALLWMAFHALLLGVGPTTPGYLTFLADFPTLLVGIGLLRPLWRRSGHATRLTAATLAGLITGLLYCNLVDAGLGIAQLEHGLYGAYFGLICERYREEPRLTASLLDFAGFMALMQLTFMAMAWEAAWMTAPCLRYHLFHACGVQLAFSLGCRASQAIRHSDLRLSPSR